MTQQTDNSTLIETPTDTTIRIVREFDAPRELVWQVYVDPALMPEWLGPRGTRMTIEQIDISPGGTYRYTHYGEGGQAHVFFGEYLQVVPPELVVSTFRYAGFDDGGSTDSVSFEALDDGRTRLVATCTFQSKEDRDRMIQSGMERGVRQGYERLDELLATRS